MFHPLCVVFSALNPEARGCVTIQWAGIGRTTTVAYYPFPFFLVLKGVIRVGRT